MPTTTTVPTTGPGAPGPSSPVPTTADIYNDILGDTSLHDVTRLEPRSGELLNRASWIGPDTAMVVFLVKYSTTPGWRNVMLQRDVVNKPYMLRIANEFFVAQPDAASAHEAGTVRGEHVQARPKNIVTTLRQGLEHGPTREHLASPTGFYYLIRHKGDRHTIATCDRLEDAARVADALGHDTCVIVRREANHKGERVLRWMYDVVPVLAT